MDGYYFTKVTVPGKRYHVKLKFEKAELKIKHNIKSRQMGLIRRAWTRVENI
jgi:hypothetical protein